MRQDQNTRSNRQDQEQEKNRSRATRKAGSMANDLLSTPLNPNHDYANDIELGTYVDARERYDHLYGETVPNVNQVEFGRENNEKNRNVEFSEEKTLDNQERTNRNAKPTNRSVNDHPANKSTKSNKK